MEAEKEWAMGMAERTKGHNDRAGRQIGGVSAGERVGVTIEHTQEKCLMAKQSQTTTRGCMRRPFNHLLPTPLFEPATSNNIRRRRTLPTPL